MAKSQTQVSVLAFERRVSSSNGLFFGVDWGRGEKEIGRPLPVQEKSVRGVIDNRLKTSEQSQTKVEAKIENPNPQTVDYCALGMHEDTLRVRFNIQVAGRVEPCACNNPLVKTRIGSMVSEFSENDGFETLCFKYVTNLANGRFLWRNRLGAEKIEIRVVLPEENIIFEDVPIKDFEDLDENIKSNVKKIGSKMADVLSGNVNHVNLGVDARVKRFPGIEVYPSQELVLDNSRGKGKKSKYLFRALYNENEVAALHPQKITNAIHTIDDWYSDDADRPISVNSYGAVTNEGKAYREPKKNDFYTLFDKAVQEGLGVLDSKEQKYVMAMLVRGGVFGEGGE